MLCIQYGTFSKRLLVYNWNPQKERIPRKKFHIFAGNCDPINEAQKISVKTFHVSHVVYFQALYRYLTDYQNRFFLGV